MIKDLEEKLGLDYKSFSNLVKQKLEKHNHPEPNSNFFSVFWDGNEVMFDDNEIIKTIEINNLNSLRKKHKNFPIKNKLEHILEYLSTNNIEWEVFSKYSYGKHLVIKINKFIYYEFMFENGRFRLQLIRVSNAECT